MLPIRPACMDDDEYAGWTRLNVASRTASPCDDCLAGFAADMRAIGRCDGTPLGYEDDEEDIDIVPKGLGHDERARWLWTMPEYRERVMSAQTSTYRSRRGDAPARALSMRRSGMPWSRIGEHLGISATAARKWALAAEEEEQVA